MILWLASYPRSGNTFFRVVLRHALGVHSCSRYFEERIEHRLGLGGPYRDMTIDELRATHRQLFVKTHEVSANTDDPAIFIVRDGRDALTSYAHYILSRGETAPAEHIEPEKRFEYTLRDLISYEKSFGGWGPNTISWLDRTGPTAVVRFEDLVREPVETVMTALDTVRYAGDWSLLGRRLGGWMAARSLARRRTRGEVPTFESLNEQFPDFFRRGRTGSYRTEMSDELQTLFWDKYGPVMERLGYEA